MLAQQLARFEPFQHLQWNQLLTLASHCRRVNVAPGRRLQRKASSPNLFYFLLEGKVGLGGSCWQQTFSHTSPRALRPLFAEPLKGETTALGYLDTLSATRLLLVDSSPVQFLLGKSPADSPIGNLPRVGECAEGWMERLVKRELMRGMAPLELQKFFRALTLQEFSAGRTIIDRGQRADRLYLVKQGSVTVHPQGQIRVLGPGAFFGQDGLICEQPRNARVTMRAAGAVASLPGVSFQTLMHPLLKQRHCLEVGAAERRCDSRVLWIGSKPERESTSLAQSAGKLQIHLPLADLRVGLRGLEQDVLYRISGGHTTHRTLAVFLLREAGYFAEILEPGSRYTLTDQTSTLQPMAAFGYSDHLE